MEAFDLYNPDPNVGKRMFWYSQADIYIARSGGVALTNTLRLADVMLNITMNRQSLPQLGLHLRGLQAFLRLVPNLRDEGLFLV